MSTVPKKARKRSLRSSTHPSVGPQIAEAIDQTKGGSKLSVTFYTQDNKGGVRVNLKNARVDYTHVIHNPVEAFRYLGLLFGLLFQRGNS